MREMSNCCKVERHHSDRGAAGLQLICCKLTCKVLILKIYTMETLLHYFTLVHALPSSIANMTVKYIKVLVLVRCF